MTPTDLDAIRERLTAATQLPWKVYQGDVICYTPHDYDRICDDVSHADADLIANAPTDLTALLAIVDRVRETVEQSDRIYIECVECYCRPSGAWHLCQWHDGFDEANDRVRTILEGNGV